ncbi:MAG: hypothetical protein WC942_04010 [Clostridia bacterium]|jgi:hypothetical protein
MTIKFTPINMNNKRLITPSVINKIIESLRTNILPNTLENDIQKLSNEYVIECVQSKHTRDSIIEIIYELAETEVSNVVEEASENIGTYVHKAIESEIDEFFQSKTGSSIIEDRVNAVIEESIEESDEHINTVLDDIITKRVLKALNETNFEQLVLSMVTSRVQDIIDSRIKEAVNNGVESLKSKFRFW